MRAEVGAAGGLLPQSGEAGRAWRARGQVLEAGDLYAILFQYLWLAFKAPVAPALGEAVGRRAYSFVNDSLRTAACVDFGPEALCCAAIWWGAREGAVPPTAALTRRPARVREISRARARL